MLKAAGRYLFAGAAVLGLALVATPHAASEQEKEQEEQTEEMTPEEECEADPMCEEVVATGKRRGGGSGLAGGGGQTNLTDTVTIRNPQGNYCPVGENSDGTCRTPEDDMPPTPGESVDEDAKVVKDCAISMTGQGPPDLFRQVAVLAAEVMGSAVPLSYGSLAHIGPRTMGYASWAVSEHQVSVAITVDPDRIKANIRNRPGGRSYWHEFAEVLFHEYYHAHDILSCRCGDPHKRRVPEMTLEAYEADTQANAEVAANALVSCLPE